MNAKFCVRLVHIGQSASVTLLLTGFPLISDQHLIACANTKEDEEDFVGRASGPARSSWN